MGYCIPKFYVRIGGNHFFNMERSQDDQTKHPQNKQEESYTFLHIYSCHWLPGGRRKTGDA